MTYFTYVPKLVEAKYFEEVYDSVKDIVQVNAQRYSCMFNLHSIDMKFNGYVPMYDYINLPKCIQEIRTIVEKYSNEIFDYVLIHIYPTGESGISWHADSEGKESEIASISLGATRKFRLRKIGRTTGCDHEFLLGSGDCIFMHKPSEKNNYKGCQKVFQHCVPVQSIVNKPRINLTFRQYEI